MAISIDRLTRRITVPQADLTFISGILYEFDVDAFHTELRGIIGTQAGVVFPRAHDWNAPITLSGDVLAGALTMVNSYEVDFEDTGSPYTVKCVSANHNLADVFIPGTTEVSLIIGNTAGLIKDSEDDWSPPIKL